jgi:hypothetical protein
MALNNTFNTLAMQDNPRVTYPISAAAWKSWRNRMFLSCICVPNIKLPNHFSEQCRPPNSHDENAHRFTSNSPSTCPLWRTTTTIASCPPQPRATVHRRHCRELRGCTSKNHVPKTPNRTAPVAPPFFTPLPPNSPCHLATVPLHLRHSNAADLPHFSCQQPTSPLMF